MSIIHAAHGGVHPISMTLMGHLPLTLTEAQTDPSLLLFHVLQVHSCPVLLSVPCAEIKGHGEVCICTQLFLQHVQLCPLDLLSNPNVLLNSNVTSCYLNNSGIHVRNLFDMVQGL